MAASDRGTHEYNEQREPQGAATEIGHFQLLVRAAPAAVLDRRQRHLHQPPGLDNCRIGARRDEVHFIVDDDLEFHGVDFLEGESRHIASIMDVGEGTVEAKVLLE